MKVLVTGASGFIGKNLISHLESRPSIDIIKFTRADSPSQLPQLLDSVDFVFHLGGVNRPESPQDFLSGNFELTEALCRAIAQKEKSIPVLFSSSIQVGFDNDYGRSKALAENCLIELEKHHAVPVYIFRLPNVFGKWARPNYNSVVATFCHNIARGIDININAPAAKVRLLYVDDLVEQFLQLLDRPTHRGLNVVSEFNAHELSVSELASQLSQFEQARCDLTISAVGSGFLRALHSTYLSYLPTEKFSYELPSHSDQRGMFVEMLKTGDSGQFSFFTAHPGITRGGHFHHTKTEKFLVVVGEALFRFRNIQTEEYYEKRTSSDRPEVIETVPGWSHDITNIGDKDLVVILWANEQFDPQKPDTYSDPLDNT